MAESKKSVSELRAELWKELDGGKINILKKYDVEFLEDFGFFKKGQQAKGLSEFDFKLYTKNKVAKEIR